MQIRMNKKTMKKQESIYSSIHNRQNTQQGPHTTKFKKVTTDSGQSSSEIKKQFINIVKYLENQYKKNNQVYKEKYIELSQAVFDLFEQVNKFYAIKFSKNITKENNQAQEFGHQFGPEYANGEPLLLIEYCMKFCEHVEQQLNIFDSRQQKLRKEMLDMFSMSGNYNFLEIVAQKNLQAHSTLCKNQELESQIQIMDDKLTLSQQTIETYHTKLQQFRSDYHLVIVSMADMLKRCENSQLELKQENRLQGQLLQSHKIEFERYKGSFKQREGLVEKQNKMRKMLQKQFEQKQKMLIKQIQHEAQLRINPKFK